MRLQPRSLAAHEQNLKKKKGAMGGGLCLASVYQISPKEIQNVHSMTEAEQTFSFFGSVMAVDLSAVSGMSHNKKSVHQTEAHHL